MSHNRINISIGSVFGDWSVIGDGASYGEAKRIGYPCRCVCGAERIVGSQNLRNGASKGCGCRKIKENADRTRTHGAGSAREHGSKAASVWLDMKKRCLNPNCRNYPRYGGRGITICDRWLGDDGFNNFLLDMGEPSKGYSIGRRDNNGPYEPNNCRWETRKQQQSNMRSNRYGWLDGEKLTMEEIARREGLAPQSIKGRMLKGMYQHK
jgi:hypothetical protein